jgi:hypothetical protein
MTLGLTECGVVRVFCQVTLLVNQYYQTQNDDRVKNSLCDYVGGVKKDNSISNGVGVGANVYINNLYSRITSGRENEIVNVSVLLGTKDSNGDIATELSGSDIEVTRFEIARLDYADIEVVKNG